MKLRRDELESRVQTLLADPRNQEHPLAAALQELWQHMNEHALRLERITALSDSYQSMALERERGLGERLENQLRRISRIVKISDRYQTMLREVNTQLQEASNRDPLTNAPNRRVLMSRLQEAHASNVAGHDTPFVVIMLDVDHFKTINDRYGHEAGDRALVELSGTLCADLRPDDICGRWGGEEFLLLLPQTTLETAHAMIEHKLKAVRNMRIHIGHYTTIQLTMSAGMAQYLSGEAISSTLSRADAALYQAKEQGRDQIAP